MNVNSWNKHEINLKIAANLFGIAILTQEEMKKEAVVQWKIQPQCRIFHSFEAVDKGDGQFDFYQKIPNYAKDRGESMKIVEKLLSEKWQFRLKESFSSYICEFSREEPFPGRLTTHTVRASAQAITMPLAICLAALRLYGIEV